jgi:hypothetical protein
VASRLSQILDLMLVEDDGCIFPRLAQNVEEQIGNPLCKLPPLFAPGAVGAGCGASWMTRMCTIGMWLSFER